MSGNLFSFDRCDINGRNILHQAALREDLGVIMGCKGYIEFDKLDRNGMTPLFLAIKEECFKSAKYLLNNGANPNAFNEKFGSVLSLALVKMQFYLVQTMLSRGANPNLQDKDGNTPLHYLFALWKDQPEYLLAGT